MIYSDIAEHWGIPFSNVVNRTHSIQRRTPNTQRARQIKRYQPSSLQIWSDFLFFFCSGLVVTFYKSNQSNELILIPNSTYAESKHSQQSEHNNYCNTIFKIKSSYKTHWIQFQTTDTQSTGRIACRQGRIPRPDREDNRWEWWDDPREGLVWRGGEIKDQEYFLLVPPW